MDPSATVAVCTYLKLTVLLVIWMQQRNRYSLEFKAEALKLTENASVASAARQLGLHESQIYSWRSAERGKAHSSSREVELSTENARLNRQLSEQTEELAILKKRPPTSRRTKNSALPLHDEHRHQFAVLRRAIVLGVSRSGFYRWQQMRHNFSLAAQSQKRLEEQVLCTLNLSKQRDGARRVRSKLSSQDERYDVKTIGVSMQRQSLRRRRHAS